MRVGLIDFDGRLPNVALMKLSTYYKSQGATVLLNDFNRSDVDQVFCSVIFTKSKAKAARLADFFPNITFGGTGWDLTTTLPREIEMCQPDYDLYQPKDILPRLKGIMKSETKRKKCQIMLDAGIGFTSRGCVRSCGFCAVPAKEGSLHHVGTIASLINPRSNVLILLDNNLTADPDCLEKLREIRERSIIVDITQGVDVRTMTPEIAKALSDVKHLRSLHYAWDLMPFEHQVMEGVRTLSSFVKPWRHLCYMLAGFDTSFEEDMYRMRKLVELDVTPYVMVYNDKRDIRLQHFKRWVNGRFHKVCSFEDYDPWRRDRGLYASGVLA